MLTKSVIQIMSSSQLETLFNAVGKEMQERGIIDYWITAKPLSDEEKDEYLKSEEES